MAKQPIGFGQRDRRPETAAVFVRVPVEEAERLDRVAFRLRRPKREIVAALLSALETDAGKLVLGHADVKPAPRAAGDEVLTLEQLASLLQVEPEVVRALARRGELPGRKVGREWRFSREAVLDWLRGGTPAAPAV